MNASIRTVHESEPKQLALSRVLSRFVPHRNQLPELIEQLTSAGWTPLLHGAREHISFLAGDRLDPWNLAFAGNIRDGSAFDYHPQDNRFHLFFEMFPRGNSIVCLLITPFSSFGFDVAGEADLYERPDAGDAIGDDDLYGISLWQMQRLDVCCFSQNRKLAEQNCREFVEDLLKACTRLCCDPPLKPTFRRTLPESIDDAYDLRELQNSPCVLEEVAVKAGNALVDFDLRSRLLEVKSGRNPNMDSNLSQRCARLGLAAEDKQSLTQLAVTLLDKNHWITVHISKVLIEHGIDQENIRWNVVREGEEIDILVLVHHELWLFELKGKEFGVGDARAFRHRCELFAPDVAFVITTDTVSPHAKRLLGNLKFERDVGYSHPVTKEVRKRLRSRLRPRIVRR